VMQIMTNPLKDPVFKGCTRPAMLWGVPLVAFVLVGGAMLIPAIWALLVRPPIGVVLLVLMIPVFVGMRIVTKRDDQRLRQLALRLSMSLRQRNRAFWLARSYAPIRFKRRF